MLGITPIRVRRRTTDNSPEHGRHKQRAAQAARRVCPLKGTRWTRRISGYDRPRIPDPTCSERSGATVASAPVPVKAVRTDGEGTPTSGREVALALRHPSRLGPGRCPVGLVRIIPTFWSNRAYKNFGQAPIVSRLAWTDDTRELAAKRWLHASLRSRLLVTLPGRGSRMHRRRGCRGAGVGAGRVCNLPGPVHRSARRWCRGAPFAPSQVIHAATASVAGHDQAL
jgi:hypothetical protein